jgi:hypothetical protein
LVESPSLFLPGFPRISTQFDPGVDAPVRPSGMALSLQSRSGMWPAIFCATAAVGLVVGYVEGLLSGMTIVGLGIAWVAG